ncbi:MAG: stage II sporulation protein R [Bacilli bacterium]|nr:stage II sporulation protein R [Bacilli bacterium]
MKKILIILSISFIVIMMNTRASSKLIPDEAIRFRVIANSDTEYDQKIKMIVKEKVEKELYKILKNTKGIDNAREIIKDNVGIIDSIVNKTLIEENYDKTYDVNYGMNYFPEKEYKGVKYKEGYYESLVIKLGEGKGKNWWCVLFPPLCLVEAEESDKVEYKFFIKELIDKYL